MADNPTLNPPGEQMNQVLGQLIISFYAHAATSPLKLLSISTMICQKVRPTAFVLNSTFTEAVAEAEMNLCGRHVGKSNAGTPPLELGTTCRLPTSNLRSIFPAGTRVDSDKHCHIARPVCASWNTQNFSEVPCKYFMADTKYHLELACQETVSHRKPECQQYWCPAIISYYSSLNSGFDWLTIIYWWCI